MSDTEYQHLLSETDDALHSAVQDVSGEWEPSRAERSQRALSSLVKKRVKALRKAHPPVRVQDAHRELVTALDGLRELFVRHRGIGYICFNSRLTKTNDSRGGEDHRDVLLALLATDLTAERVRAAAARLAGLGWRFGRFLPGPPPDGPWRPPNGAIIQCRNRRTKRSRLTIDNRLDRDVVVSLVEENSPPAIPTLMFYIRAGDGIETSQIPDRFHIYYKSGLQWNNGTHQFMRGARHHRSADLFDVSRPCSVRIALGGPLNRPTDPQVATQLGDDWAEMLQRVNDMAPRGEALRTQDIAPY